MFRFFPLPLILLAAVLPFVESLVAQSPPRAEVAKGKKIAVLVGVNGYLNKPFENLKYAEQDMTDLKVRLKKAGFDVILLLGSEAGDKEASRANIAAVLLDKREENERYAFRNVTGEDDQVLVAFSGHGEQIEVLEKEDGGKAEKREVPFFCPKRAESGTPSTMVSMNEVLKTFNGSKAKALLLVDACRSFAVNREGTKGAVIDRKRVDSLRPNVGGMFAASDRQAAREHEKAGTDGHGLFFQAVLEAMDHEKCRDRDGNVVWSRMTDEIGDTVARKSKELFPTLRDDEHQVPQPFGGFPRKFVLAAATIAPPGAMVDETTEAYTWKGERRTRTVQTLRCGTATIEFVKVLMKGKRFTMGSDKKKDRDAGDDELPAHEVTFTKDLWVAKYPVTKGQFAAFAKAKGFQTEAEVDGEGGYGYDGAKLEGRKAKYTWKDWGHPNETDKHPVANVTWNDGAAFCDWMSAENKLKSGFAKTDGKWDLTDYKALVGVRLLTEAEYEYANRGGETTIYITGDKVDSMEGYANIADKSAKAKFDYLTTADFDDGEVFTSAVGKYKANGFGLHDMTGNVWSWCLDWYDAKLYARGDVTAPGANRGGEQACRVLRGGSWDFDPVHCRAACRGDFAPDYRNDVCGFRVCVVLD